MNIVEYRALKAQEAEQSNSKPEGEQPNVQAEQSTATPTTQTTETATQTSGATNQNGEQGDSGETNPTVPQTVEIDGQQVPIEELTKGYLRQSDYTRKTQELARERQQNQVAKQLYEAISSNPDVAKQIAEQTGIPYVDPQTAQVMELQNKYQDLLLEKEVNDLQSRYDDFDAKEVLQFAYDNRYENLEDAYLIMKSKSLASTPAPEPVDIQSLTEQIRQQVLAELQSNVDTGTIIQTGGESAPVRDNTPVLSQQEVKVARSLRMTPEEYVKWRDKR